MRSNEETGAEVPLPELAAAITAGAVRLAAATATWLRLVAEFDRRGGWHGIGILSCAHWLAWQCGLGPGAAREHVRVARALSGLPVVEAAFAAGRLSYSKVRALTRVASADCETALVEFALRATASQTERFCRQWRRADAAAAEDHARRAEDGQVFQHRYDDDGFLTITVRLPAAEGAALMTAVEARAERDARRERAQAKRALARHDEIRSSGGVVDLDLQERCTEDAAVGRVRERTAARRVTALAALVQTGAGRDHRRPGDPPRREVVVHVDAAVLADDAAAGRAHVEGGPALTGAQTRRMLCEATVVAMLERDREPLAVGRRKRRATRAQWRALLRRDAGCARPGCPETRVERLHAHHMRHWLFGGRTDIDNLVLLCDVDHGLVHEHDLVLHRQGGRLVVTAPDGTRLWGSADVAFTAGLDGAAPDPDSGGDAYAGVHPIDTSTGRRPAADAGTRTAPAAATGEGSLPERGRGVAPERGDGRPTAPALGRRTAPGHVPPGRTRTRPAMSRPGARSTGRRGSVVPAATMRRRDDAPWSDIPAPVGDARTDRLNGDTGLDRLDGLDGLDGLDQILFPDGAPPRPVPHEAPNERMNTAWAIGVLMGNRDLARRLETERRGEPDRAFPRERPVVRRTARPDRGGEPGR